MTSHPLPSALSTAAYDKMDGWDQVVLLHEYLADLSIRLEWVEKALWEHGFCALAITVDAAENGWDRAIPGRR